jgi:hypothetical protein
MNNSLLTDPRLGQVRVASVRAYLGDHGWQLQPYPGPELLVFSGPPDDKGQPIVQVLPSSEHLRDYRMRLEELIKSLSICEDRPADQILTEMLQAAPTEDVPPPAPNGAASSVTPRPVP